MDRVGCQRRTDLLTISPTLRHISWVVDSKRPFAGPEQVLRYLSRHTHRVAISNSRLVDMTDDCVSFTWKDYRHEARIARLDPPPA